MNKVEEGVPAKVTQRKDFSVAAEPRRVRGEKISWDSKAKELLYRDYVYLYYLCVCSYHCSKQGTKEITWQRPIISKYIDLNKVREIIQDVSHHTGSSGDLPEKKKKKTLDSYLTHQEICVHHYKKAADQICPVPTIMLEDVKVRCIFPNNPLSSLPQLPTHAPEFVPTPWVTQEWMDKLGIDSNSDLSEEERQLLKYVITTNGQSIAFEEDERVSECIFMVLFQTFILQHIHTHSTSSLPLYDSWHTSRSR